MGHFIIPGSQNHGIILCQPQHEVPSESTCIIEGAARGGTSMIGALLWSAGYVLEAEAPSYENLEWKHALKYGGDYGAIINRRNNTYPRWGIKHPGLLDWWKSHWELFLGTLRNPRVVIVMRDPVAVDVRAWTADRNHTIELVIKQMGQLVNWAIGTTFPVALVSYEKMISANAETQYYFEEFIGASCDWDLVEPNNELYIRQIGTRPIL